MKCGTVPLRPACCLFMEWFSLQTSDLPPVQRDCILSHIMIIWVTFQISDTMWKCLCGWTCWIRRNHLLFKHIIMWFYIILVTLLVSAFLFHLSSLLPNSSGFLEEQRLQGKCLWLQWARDCCYLSMGIPSTVSACICSWICQMDFTHEIIMTTT